MDPHHTHTHHHPNWGGVGGNPTPRHDHTTKHQPCAIRSGRWPAIKGDDEWNRILLGFRLMPTKLLSCTIHSMGTLPPPQPLILQVVPMVTRTAHRVRATRVTSCTVALRHTRGATATASTSVTTIRPATTASKKRAVSVCVGENVGV